MIPLVNSTYNKLTNIICSALCICVVNCLNLNLHTCMHLLIPPKCLPSFFFLYALIMIIIFNFELLCFPPSLVQNFYLILYVNCEIKSCDFDKKNCFLVRKAELTKKDPRAGNKTETSWQFSGEYFESSIWSPKNDEGYLWRE